MEDQAEKRRCTQTTKAGDPCRAWALAGAGTCLAHADGPTRAKMGFGGPENGAKGGEARRIPKLSEILRARVEERADEIIDRLFGMLDAKRALVVGNGSGARIEFAPDEELALRAIREIFDRAEGRPQQSIAAKATVQHAQLDMEIEELLVEDQQRAFIAAFPGVRSQHPHPDGTYPGGLPISRAGEDTAVEQEPPEPPREHVEPAPADAEPPRERPEPEPERRRAPSWEERALEELA